MKAANGWALAKNSMSGHAVEERADAGGAVRTARHGIVSHIQREVESSCRCGQLSRRYARRSYTAKKMPELIEGQAVVCDLTRERTHGRRVGRCYVYGQDIAEALISAGLARDCPRFSGGQYAAAETAEARELPFPSYCRPR